MSSRSVVETQNKGTRTRCDRSALSMAQVIYTLTAILPSSSSSRRPRFVTPADSSSSTNSWLPTKPLDVANQSKSQKRKAAIATAFFNNLEPPHHVTYLSGMYQEPLGGGWYSTAEFTIDWRRRRKRRHLFRTSRWERSGFPFDY